MTKENLTEEQINKILEADKIIYEYIEWNKTREGYDYWDKVYQALKRIANSIPEGEKEIELNGRKYRLVEEWTGVK